MAYKLIRVATRQALKEFDMKLAMLLMFIIFCLAATGCGGLAPILQPSYAEQLDSAWTQGAAGDRQASSFQVYRADPYAVHLEIEDTDSQEGLEHLNGDGGASLNAYAACLTLKVIF